MGPIRSWGLGNHTERDLDLSYNITPPSQLQPTRIFMAREKYTLIYSIVVVIYLDIHDRRR